MITTNIPLLNPVPAGEIQAGANPSQLVSNRIWQEAVQTCVRFLVKQAPATCERGVRITLDHMRNVQLFGLSQGECDIIAGLLNVGTANEVKTYKAWWNLSAAARTVLHELAFDVAAALVIEAYKLKGKGLKTKRARDAWYDLMIAATSVNPGKQNYARYSLSW